MTSLCCWSGNFAAVAIQNATLHAETASAPRDCDGEPLREGGWFDLEVKQLATVYREVSAIFQTDAFLIAYT
jgi:hypothetical protein